MMRFGQRFLVNDLFPIKFAIPELQPHPFRQIIHRRTDAARGGLRVRIAFELLHPFAIHQYVSQRLVWACDKIRIPRTRRSHAEGTV
jgi:hypothetical protein